MRAFSGVHVTSANCVVTRSTTTGPCASSCCTNVVTWASVCVDAVNVFCVVAVRDEATLVWLPLIPTDGSVVVVDVDELPGGVWVAVLPVALMLPVALLAEPLRL